MQALRKYELKNKELISAVQGGFSTVKLWSVFVFNWELFLFFEYVLTQLIVVNLEWISVFCFCEFVEFRIWNFKIFTFIAIYKIMHLSQFFLEEGWGWGVGTWIWKTAKLYLGNNTDVAKHLEESWFSFFSKTCKKKPFGLYYLVFSLAV